MVHSPQAAHTHREAEPAVVARLAADLALLRAKKLTVVRERLEGRLDYDKAKALEATLDEAIRYAEGRIIAA